MNGSLQKLVAAHGMLWDADPWYRRSWIAGPQAVSLLAAAGLVLHWSFAQPTSEAPWALPQHAEQQKGGTDIWALRDSAKANAADFEKLKSRAASGESAAEFALGTLYDPIFNFSKLAASDVNVALSWYRKSAAQENIDAARVLGIHYRDGSGVAADGKVALQWFRKAAEAGDAFSENEIGLAYEKGIDWLIPDQTEAMKWYQKSAAHGNVDAARNLDALVKRQQQHAEEQKGGTDIWALRDSAKTDKADMQTLRSRAFKGEAAAQFALGTLYDPIFNFSKLVANDVNVALSWYRQSAAQGNIDAARVLGIHYRDGTGMAADGKMALQWFRKAADAGDAFSENEIGVAYEKGLDGLIADSAEAAKWYQKSAAQGYALAARNLGYRYRDGNGVAADGKVALQWFRKAADGGNADAENEVGVAYFKGIDGLTADPAEAMRWYQKSAAHGNIDAARNLGYLYRNGIGVAADGKVALQWYRKAADAGDAFSENEIGVAYLKGIGGLTADPVEAVRWFQKSAAQGNTAAAENLDIASKQHKSQR